MSTPLPKVWVFWDNSNIFIEGQRLGGQREGPAYERAVRIHFGNLFNLATAGRKVGAGVGVGSVPPELKEVWDRLKNAGVEVELQERGRVSGREQGIDQSLQVHMLRAALDTHPPQVAVLLTGDGAGYEGGFGFHADLERMHEQGWGIEVLSWRHACARALREWAEKVGVFVPLDDFYEAITFVEGVRPPVRVSLTKRRTVLPRPAPALAAPSPAATPVAVIDPKFERMLKYAERQKRRRDSSKQGRRSR